MKIGTKVIEYLLRNTEGEKDSFERLKAKILSITLLVAVFLILILDIKIIITRGIIPAIVPGTAMLMMIVMLFFVSKGLHKLAGNILSIAFLVIMIFSMFANPKGSSMPYFMLGQYYVFFVIILFSAMFASRIILIVNSVIIVVSTIYIYKASVNLIPANVKEISEYGFFIYEIMIVMVFVFSYVFTFLIKKAMTNISKKSKEIENKNIEMAGVVERVKYSTLKLTEESNLINIVSSEILQATNNQSDAVEQVASLMEKIVLSIESNTRNADSIYIKSAKSSQQLQQSSKVILQTMDHVEKISKKTIIISDIAFQTNLLSLNASIEASKAGDFGKGFGVVAQNIKNLAQKSTEAASDINKLSEAGIKISQIARKVLEKSLPEIDENANSVKKIAQLSQEQQQGANNINDLILKLAQISAKNSESALRMSSSSKELSGQAVELNQIIANFTTNKK